MRLTAKPGEHNYCRLSVNIQLLSSVTYLLKVGADNFRPRPNVASSVIKLVPKYPRPSIDFLEWDGLLRLCFKRKNRTLGAIFHQNSTLEFLAQNHHTRIKNFKKKIKKHSSTCMGPIKKPIEREGRYVIKKIVSSIIREQGFEDMRSVKMNQEDFMRFMVEMNSREVYFT